MRKMARCGRTRHGSGYLRMLKHTQNSTYFSKCTITVYKSYRVSYFVCKTEIRWATTTY